MALPPALVLLTAASLPLAWIAPALAQEEPQLATEQPQFEAETIPIYRVERTQTLRIPTQGRARALVLNPDAVEVDSVADDSILFLGLRIDSSVVHLFDNTGRHTVRIEVSELSSIVTEIQQRNAQALRERLRIPQRALKLGYRGSQRHLERGGDVSLGGTNERNRTRTQDLTAQMELPAGELYGRMVLEQRRDVDIDKEVMQPRHLSAELRKVDLGPLGPSDLAAGDRDLSLSNFTINGRRYRGFGLFPSTPYNPLLREKPALDRKIALSMFDGEEREGFGLDLPAGLQTRKARSRFAGTKVSYGLWETGHLYVTGLHRYGKRGDLRSDNVAAVGLNKAWLDEKVLLWGEAARADSDGAYEIELHTHHLPEWLSTRNRIWSVGRNYRTVTGAVAEDGQTGWKGWAGADLPVLDRKVFLFTEAILYKDRNAPNPADTDKLNNSLTLGASTLLPAQVKIQGSSTYQDQTGSPFPYVNRRAGLDLSREFLFQEGVLHSVIPFGEYRRSLFRRSNVLGFNADLDLYRAGVRASFAEGFWGAASWSEAKLEEKNPEILPALTRPKELVLEVGKNHVFRVVPANLNVSLRYEDVQNTLNKTHQPFPNRNRFAADSRFSWRLGKEREAFAEVSLSREKPETGGGRPNVDLFAQFGVQLLWDTGWTFAQKGQVTGEVFMDLNGNGRRDSGEAGLSGVRVYVEGGADTKTRSDGRYTIKGIPEGTVNVRVDQDQIPKGYSFTTPNRQQKLIVPRRPQRADFGVSTQVEFRGVAFNDLNGDRLYQEGSDRPVQGIRMLLESGQSGVTGGDGFYWIRKGLPGEHSLSVDLSSIPDGYRTLVPVQQKFQTKEGDIVRYDLPLQAQRSVGGMAFVDLNGNGTREPGEKGIQGIRLRLDGEQAGTDAGGAYRFSGVRPGRYAVTPDPAGLPSGYRFASSRPLEMEVPEGPFVRERFDFAVIPVDGPAPQPRPQPRPLETPQAVPRQGELPVGEFTKRFPAVPVPEGTQTVYLMPARGTATVRLYVQETLRSALEELVSRGAARLPQGIQVEVLPVPASVTRLKRPGLILQDSMLEPPLPGADFPVVKRFFGEPLPTLISLALEGLKEGPGPREPGRTRGATTVRGADGTPYWVWFL